MFRVEVAEFPLCASSMTLEEEVVVLREENRRLRELLEQALSRIAKLEVELEQMRNSPPPPFVKASTRRQEEKSKPRRKRAKDQNGARRRETPTQTIQHKLEQCPTCCYLLQHPQLALRRQVIELPPPQLVEITEHQLHKSWCPRCSRWRCASVDLSRPEWASAWAKQNRSAYCLPHGSVRTQGS